MDSIFGLIAMLLTFLSASVNAETMTTLAPNQLFSESTIANVRKSWSHIKSDPVAVGYGVLVNIFKKYPDYKDKFSIAKDTPTNELKSNVAFMTHSADLGNSIQSVVDNLDKPDVLVSTLKQLGKSHLQWEVLKENIISAEQPTLDFIEESLKEHATKEVLDSWKEVLHAGVTTMAQAQDE